MYNTLIASVFNESELFRNETVEENPEMTRGHIISESEDDYPYQQQEHFEENEGKDSVLGSNYFIPKVNARQTALNVKVIQRSGLSLTEIITLLKQRVDVPSIRMNMTTQNRNNANDVYFIDVSEGNIDAVFTEAVHQFQIENYIDPREHDGVLGQSTLETLGFINHRLRPRPDSSGLYGQSILNAIKSQVAAETNNEFTAANWFEYIVKPSWLGVKIHDGVHLLFLRKLKEAEKWLLEQPQYHGLTPALLGKALGFNAQSRYSASRLSASNQAMHGFGLAIDINVPGNPWIGAGWTNPDNKERTEMIRVFRKTSGDEKLPGSNVFNYLHSIAETTGTDTSNTYRIIKQRNDEFVSYLQNNSGDLAYWKKSLTFGGRDPLKGFLNLHPDLVYALRQVAGLAWGAVDFGPGASGDIMHFDYRTVGFGKILCKKIGGYVPSAGHPEIAHELTDDQNEITLFELHEAINEGETD